MKHQFIRYLMKNYSLTRRLLIIIILASQLSSIALALPENTQEIQKIFNDALANQDKGQFQIAINKYLEIINKNHLSPEILYNTGNAFLKLDKIGMAIAFYLQAKNMVPHDPDILFNLQFARSKVQSNDSIKRSIYQELIEKFSLNEYAIFFSLALWLFFMVQILRTVKPAIISRFQKAQFFITTIFILSSVLLMLSLIERFNQNYAIISTPVVSVHQAPFSESRITFKLNDGTETYLKSIQDDWLEIIDGHNRTGWIQSSNAVIINKGFIKFNH